MENKIVVIDERKVLGKAFRIYGDFENPLFLAKDVAEWIEHNKPNELIANVDDTEKLKAIISHSGQNREMWFLTEDGLYEVLMLSRKPIAKEFKKEVKKILKSIRQNGAYITKEKTQEILSNPETIMQMLQQMIDLHDAIKQKQDEIDTLEIKTTLQEEKIKIDEPKVNFANAILGTKESVLVGTFAKILKQNGVDIGQNRLFQWLRDNKYLIKRKGISYNLPTQTSVNRGLFEIIEKVIVDKYGRDILARTVRITPKGQFYLYHKLTGKISFDK